MAKFLYKANDRVTIKRKSLATEPFFDLWVPEMESYISKSGKVISSSLDYDLGGNEVECVDVAHDDGEIFTYPYYCLSTKIIIPQFACSCKIELLIGRGCKCGALIKERSLKK